MYQASKSEILYKVVASTPDELESLLSSLQIELKASVRPAFLYRDPIDQLMYAWLYIELSRLMEAGLIEMGDINGNT